MGHILLCKKKQNALSAIVKESENKFLDPPPDLDLQLNVMVLSWPILHPSLEIRSVNQTHTQTCRANDKRYDFNQHIIDILTVAYFTQAESNYVFTVFMCFYCAV